MEDETYALDPILFKNIRRGNTLVAQQTPGGKNKIIMGRKGLNKFFDLHFEFISPENRYEDQKLSVVK